MLSHTKLTKSIAHLNLPQPPIVQGKKLTLNQKLIKVLQAYLVFAKNILDR